MKQGGIRPVRQGLHGYVTVRSFNQLNIPVPLQNMVLRDYVAKLGKIYRLPVCENAFDNCYMQLNTILELGESIEGIVMCSIFMLPHRSSARQVFFERALALGLNLHFVFENRIVQTPEDARSVRDLISLRQAVDLRPKSSELRAFNFFPGKGEF